MAADPAALGKAAQLLSKAKRPVILDEFVGRDPRPSGVLIREQCADGQGFFVGDGTGVGRLTNSMTDGVHLAPEGHTALGILLARRLDWLGLRANPQPAASEPAAPAGR